MGDRVSDDELLNAIRQLADGKRKPPTSDDMRDDGEYSDTTYQNRFGSWNEAVREAGYTPHIETEVSNTALIEEIHRLAPTQDEPPSARTLAVEGKYDRSRYESRWGSWNNAVREAGYEVNKRGEITENELIHEIQRLAAEINRAPTTDEMEKEGKYAESLYWSHFGSWITALESAGLELEDSEVANRLYNAVPREELLAEIDRLAEGNNAPSVQRMQKEGKYSIGPYRNQFHSWWGAVVTAGYRPDSIRPLQPEAISRFHDATLNVSDPTHKLIGLLLSFTGLPTRLIPHFSSDWIEATGEDSIVTVPDELFDTDDVHPWKFLLPHTWTNPYTGSTEDTRLPKFADWYFDLYSEKEFSKNTVQRVSLRIAEKAELHDIRETITNSRLGDVPRVRARDLRATHAIHLARQGAPPERISRRLAIDRTNWGFGISDCYVWLSHHEGNSRDPDYNP